MGSPKGHHSAEKALEIARILLPDILSYDYSSAAGYLNLKRLQDDVIDISLNLVTNRGLTGDGVGPHSDYTAEFPPRQTTRIGGVEHMHQVNRRHLFKLAGVGTVLAAGVAIPGITRSRNESHDQVHMRATLGLPEAPLPSYATYVIEGTVDLAAGTGLLASRVLAGHPDAPSNIGLPGLGRIIAVTEIEEHGSQLTLHGLVQDRSQLQPGERPEVNIVVDRARGLVQAPFGRETVVLRLS